VYRRLDGALGAILADLPADATVLVGSDHGFGGAGTSVLHLNRWLADRGWLSFRAGRREVGARLARGVRKAALTFLPRGVQERLVRRAGRDLARRLESWSRFAAIDMAKTRAFSEELNYAPSVWLNVRGRDPDGCVAPGAEYDAAIAALSAELLAWRHPTTGAAIVRRVHRRAALYEGPATDEAPDLILELALDEGYSYPCLPTTRAETRSVRRLERREHVAGKGGGMNGSHRPEGLWVLAGRGVTSARAEASIVDVAPSVLHLAGLPVPAWMDGRLLPGIAGTMTVGDDAPVPPELGAADDHEAELRRRLHALGYLGDLNA
jgi:predicted AlkP superfamily phosphohydrolase/phosphomutase